MQDTPKIYIQKNTQVTHNIIMVVRTNLLRTNVMHLKTMQLLHDQIIFALLKSSEIFPKWEQYLEIYLVGMIILSIKNVLPHFEENCGRKIILLIRSCSRSDEKDLCRNNIIMASDKYRVIKT